MTMRLFQRAASVVVGYNSLNNVNQTFDMCVCTYLWEIVIITRADTGGRINILLFRTVSARAGTQYICVLKTNPSTSSSHDLVYQLNILITTSYRT